MAALSCINYEYYNSPKLRLFGGPKLDETIKNLKQVDSTQIPIKVQLAIGDILSTKRIAQIHKKTIPTREEFQVIEKTKELMEKLDLEDVELVGALKNLEDETASVAIDRDNISTLKGKADFDSGELRIKLNQIIQSELNVDPAPIANTLRSIRSLEREIYDVQEELNDIVINNQINESEKLINARQLETDSELATLPEPKPEVTSTPDNEIDALLQELNAPSPDFESESFTGTVDAIDNIDAANNPEYLKVEGNLNKLQLELEKQSAVLGQFRPETLDDINAILDHIDDYERIGGRLDAQYQAVDLNIRNVKNKIDGTKLERTKLEAVTEFLDHIEAAKIPDIMLKSGLPMTEMNDMYKRALTIGDTGLHYLHKEALNRSANEIADIATRVARTFAPKDDLKFANINNSTEAVVETLKHTTDALKKNRLDVISGKIGAQGIKPIEELILENMDNNENLAGKPLFYPPPTKSIDNEVLDSFSELYNVTNQIGEKIYTDKLIRNEIKNNLVKSDYDITDIDDVLDELDSENLSYIRSNQLELIWAKEKLSQAGDRVMQLTYNEQADPKFEKMVNKSMLAWMDTVNHLELKKQNVMEALNVLKPAAVNSKNINPEDYC